MFDSDSENRSPAPPIGQGQAMRNVKRRASLDVPKLNYRRKSVENLVVSSHDAIGQSISHALSFSGAITHQVSHFTSSDHRSASRSPSPCRRSLAAPILEHGDSSAQSNDNGGNIISVKYSGDTISNVSNSSPPPSLSLSTPLPEQNFLPPLNRSASQECHPKTSNQSSSNLTAATLTTQKSQEGRSKKKSWYSALYPTYKSRSEDFKRIFKDVPDDERLIVDYSCAIQKDILVHGRLYVSQNYLCFYANIFRWETFLSLRWKDVTAITKEKTALVIPNAILVCTDYEKHFFTSFAGRDKAYLMLFRQWQNALMDQPMSNQDLWQWVHICYGEELGFNTDDEDYPQNFLEDDKLSGMRLSAESITEAFLEQSMESAAARNEDLGSPPLVDLSSTASTNNSSSPQWPRCASLPHVSKHTTNGNFNGGDTLQTDMSDTSESEPDKPLSFGHELHGSQCTDPHDGRKLVSTDVHVHIDQLFTMMFTNSKFYIELLATRKTTDLVQASWKHNPDTGLKCRQVSFTILLGQAVGPKTAQVTETQVMLECTKPGQVYSIEVTSNNAGIPYADSFTVIVHYCLHRVSENVTNLQVFGQIKYRKNVWAFVRGFIEKNCWAGLDDYFDTFLKAVHTEVEDERGPSKRKSRRRRRGIGTQRELEIGILQASPMHRPLASRKSLTGTPSHHGGAPPIIPPNFFSSKLFWILLFCFLCLMVTLNGVLYWKLWNMDNNSRGMFDSDKFPANVISHENSPTPELIAEWSKLLKDQSSFHIAELDKWRKALNDAISLLKHTETALANLQSVIKPSLERPPPSTSLPHSEL